MVASAVLNIQAEIESSRRRLHQVLQRLELAERFAAVRDEKNLDCISNINEGPSLCDRSVELQHVGQDDLLPLRPDNQVLL